MYMLVCEEVSRSPIEVRWLWLVYSYPNNCNVLWHNVKHFILACELCNLIWARHMYLIAHRSRSMTKAHRTQLHDGTALAGAVNGTLIGSILGIVARHSFPRTDSRLPMTQSQQHTKVQQATCRTTISSSWRFNSAISFCNWSTLFREDWPSVVPSSLASVAITSVESLSRTMASKVVKPSGSWLMISLIAVASAGCDAWAVLVVICVSSFCTAEMPLVRYTSSSSLRVLGAKIACVM